jgi:F0F1-type ATP synthase delta subunit
MIDYNLSKYQGLIEQIQKNVLDELLLASHFDQLQNSLGLLQDMTDNNELDLILTQKTKNLKQKKAYIQKVIDGIKSPCLQKEMNGILSKAQGEADLEFFENRNLSAFLNQLAMRVKNIQIIRLTVAIEFAEADLKDMIKVIESRIHKPAVLDLTVDHSLIGGAIIQRGNYLNDYSVRTRLGQFKNNWQAKLEESKSKTIEKSMEEA